MKLLKFGTVLALVAAVTATANAVTFLEPFQGPVKFKFESWDMQTVYNTSQITADQVYSGISTLDALPQSSPSGAAMPIPSGFGSPYAGQNEDGWGIVRVTEIRSDDGLGTLLWSGATDPKSELAGMFYGNVDNALFIDSTTGQQTIQSDGYFFKLYEQPKGTFDPAQGASNRTGFDSYNTVGTDANGDPLAGSTLLLQGQATDGLPLLAGTTGPATHVTHFTSTGADTGYGKGDMYIQVTGGQWASLFTTGEFPDSPDANLFMQSTLFAVDSRPTANFDWTSTNDDPMRGTVQQGAVPEPLSMLLLATAGSGLYGYLRKRRA